MFRLSRGHYCFSFALFKPTGSISTFSLYPSRRRQIRELPANISARMMHKSVYQWQDGVEDLEPYSANGYHPTHLGDRFYDNRYEVVHKLGYGTYSTVWLVKDHHEGNLAAMKIIVAACSERSIGTEIKVLKLLSSGQIDHPGRPYVQRLLNHFTITGPNGHHQCIVTELAGCSVALSKDECPPWKFSMTVARSIAAQALLGLEYIHSCGVIHGDLHSKNLLFPFSYSTKIGDIDLLYQKGGLPERIPMKRYDKKEIGPEAPKYCVPSMHLGKGCDEILDSEAHITIADFGEAFPADEHSNKELATPVLLLPPEYIFGEYPISPAADIWTFGNTLFDLLGSRHLFEGVFPTRDDTVAEMISTLGPLPKRWWDRWEKKSLYFHEDGSWDKKNDHYDPVSISLKERIATMGREKEFGQEEETAIQKLLAGMLNYEPSQRISAKHAVVSEWMQRWGIPAMKKVQQQRMEENKEAVAQSC